uniref:C-type lectin domain-containing protein n=1 Tax=Xiphophorus maculatus TaxID=8083 RepID=A0A3B5PSB5_XIPMA
MWQIKDGRRGGHLTPLGWMLVLVKVTKILQEAESWQESIRSCKNQTLDLISLPSEALQKQTCQNLRGNDAKQVWIGTRRSSLTGDWYWLDESDFNDTNWAGSEPGDVSEGQCAVMSLEGDGDCGWKDRNCCEDARPLCYAIL